MRTRENLTEKEIFKLNLGTSLVVQWLRLRASSARGMDSMPGPGTNILHAACCSVAKKKKKDKLNQNDKQKQVSHRFGKQSVPGGRGKG